MRKTLCLLSMVIMLFSLAACNTAPAGQATAPGNANTATPASSSSVDSKYDEPMTIHFASVQIKEGADYNSDDMSTFFRNKFNFTWDIIPMTWDNWAEKMRIWINSNDMPDLATWDFVYGEAVNYAEQGLVRKLPDDWKTRWPNVANAYKASNIGEAIEERTNGTYYLPKPIFFTHQPCDPLVVHIDMIMRKDWMQAVGAEIKDCYKVSEVLDIARKIKQQDPGNLGSKLLPINMIPNFAEAFFITSNSSYSILSNQFYKGDDNKYHWGPASPDTLVGLKLYQQAYREGLLNPEFFTLKEGDDVASFSSSGQAGVYYEVGQASIFQTIDQELKKNLNLDADQVMHVAYVLGEDGKYHNEESMNFWTTVIFSPKMEEAKFERIMDMLDFSASDQGQLMIRLGFEGKDYTVEPDGSYKVLWEAGKNIYDIYPSQDPVYGNMLVLSDDFAIIDPSLPQKYKDITWNMYQGKAAHYDSASVPRRDWTVYFQDSPSRRKVNFDFGKEYAQLVTMEGDLETNWLKWIEDKKPLVDPVLDDLNALIQ